MKRLTGVIAISTLLLTVVTAAQASEALLERGRDLARAGDLAAALAVWDEFKQQAPDDPRSYVYASQALADAERTEDARNELQQAAKLKPERPADMVAYAQALARLGWADVAIEALTSVEDRLEAGGLRLLCDLLYKGRQAQESLRVADTLRSRFPDSPGIDTLRGEAFLLEEKYADALAAFRRAVEADPTEAAAQHGLGQSLWLVEGSEEARGPLEKAVELEPTNWSYLHILAIVSSKFNRHQEAIGYLERATELAGAPAQILFDLGNTYRQTGETARAREVLARYQQRYAQEEEQANRRQIIDQLLNQGQQQLDAGRVLEAVKTFQRILETDPDDWKAHSLLAKIYVSSGRLASARSHLDRMLELGPDNSESSFLMAFYLHQQRRNRDALHYGQRARELLPGNPELRNLLGNIHLALGDRQAAAAEYRAALNLVPDNPVFRLNYESVASTPH